MGALKSKIHSLLKRLTVRTMYWLGFTNSGSIRNNLRYEFYHMLCRMNFRRNNGPTSIRAIQTSALSTYKTNAALVFPPSPEILAAMDAIPADILSRFDDPQDQNTSRYSFIHSFFFSSDDFEQVRGLLTAEIDAAAKHILGSYYAVNSAMAIHTEPSSEPPRSSFLWHFDDFPDCRLKIFYYLTDTYKTNGATQVHTWKSAMDLKKRGFLDRRKVTPSILRDLNDPQRYNVVEGLRGTAFIFNENTIHRAVIPEKTWRDVIIFEIVPSLNPNVPYLSQHQIYWNHPFELLYPKAEGNVKDLSYV